MVYLQEYFVFLKINFFCGILHEALIKIQREKDNHEKLLSPNHWSKKATINELENYYKFYVD